MNDQSLTPEQQELALDLVQLALDLSGFIDPTPVSDGSSALVSLGRAQWLDAVLSGVSVIPYIGDLAKAGKLPKYLKTLETAVTMASKSKNLARALLPGMQNLHNVLKLFPRGANRYIDRMQDTVRTFLTKHNGKSVPLRLPDISGQFKSSVKEVGDQVHEVTTGRLGVPGKVKTHRSSYSQSKVSRKTGDHAGHRAADRFGAPGDETNLARQNHVMNDSGTWYQLEDLWEQKLKAGSGIEVTIRDIYKKSDYKPKIGAKNPQNRPYKRKVTWTEITPDGRRVDHEWEDVIYVNWDTPKSRAARGETPEDISPDGADVVDIFTRKKLR